MLFGHRFVQSGLTKNWMRWPAAPPTVTGWGVPATSPGCAVMKSTQSATVFPAPAFRAAEQSAFYSGIARWLSTWMSNVAGDGLRL
jgi:hypothetical protein